jgi:hypothetical protein
MNRSYLRLRNIAFPQSQLWLYRRQTWMPGRWQRWENHWAHCRSPEHEFTAEREYLVKIHDRYDRAGRPQQTPISVIFAPFRQVKTI